MIYYIGGVKGGVGKSLAAMAVVHHIGYDNGCIAETDNGNPDVFKALQGKTKACETFNIREKDGWLDLLDFIGENADSPIVINSGAANNDTVDMHGDYLLEAARLTNKPICVIWLMNQGKDGCVLLNKFLQKMGSDNVSYNVVLNTSCNDGAQFTEWEGSTAKKNIEALGGGVFEFDSLANRCKEDFYNRRLSFAESLETMKFASKIEMNSWLAKTSSWLDKLVFPA